MDLNFCLNPTALSDLKALRSQAEKDANLKLWIRASALIAVAEFGSTREKAAETYDVSARSLFLWQSSFLANGIPGLTGKPYPGKKRRLSEEQLKQLKAWVEAGPEATGLDTGIWTAPIVQTLIQERFNIKLSVWAVRRTLHKLGFSLQYPKKNSQKRTWSSKMNG